MWADGRRRAISAAGVILDRMPSGYSGTPTAKKLGIAPDSDVVVLGAPGDYTALIDGLPAGFRFGTALRARADLVHVFVTKAQVLERRIGDLRAAIAPDGALWVSWPKKASKVATDVTEDVVRRIALANGLVDVKVCAIDAVWSGLKLVIPVAERGRPSSSRPFAPASAASAPPRARRRSRTSADAGRRRTSDA